MVEPDPDFVCVYYVDGSTPGEKYTVNLLKFNGNGSCTCMDFEQRRAWKCEKALLQLAGHETPGVDPIKLQSIDTMCKHIYFARSKITNDMLIILSQQAREDEQDG